MPSSPRASALNNRRRLGCRLRVDFEVGALQVGLEQFGYDRVRRRKDQGAERDHGGLSPRHLDLSNAAPRFISIHETSVAEDIVKVVVGWKLDFPAVQTISRLSLPIIPSESSKAGARGK